MFYHSFFIFSQLPLERKKVISSDKQTTTADSNLPKTGLGTGIWVVTLKMSLVSAKMEMELYSPCRASIVLPQGKVLSKVKWTSILIHASPIATALFSFHQPLWKEAKWLNGIAEDLPELIKSFIWMKWTQLSCQYFKLTIYFLICCSFHSLNLWKNGILKCLRCSPQNMIYFSSNVLKLNYEK